MDGLGGRRFAIELCPLAIVVLLGKNCDIHLIAYIKVCVQYMQVSCSGFQSCNSAFGGFAYSVTSAQFGRRDNWSWASFLARIGPMSASGGGVPPPTPSRRSQSTNVKVAVRCRPFNSREKGLKSKVDQAKTTITDPKGRSAPHAFTFDYSYWWDTA